ncbi:MAG: UDP-N-acetylmuramoyl-L-alanine--D-glutamate ligase, partial [Burkholderiales bacterium]|nr:UDP-N-acetylmuramoyl-L-alanine--D-glutamate ligase [Burkholderiales bacterium]
MKFDLRNRRVLVLGLGITGYSLVRYLLRRGAQVMVADTRTAPPFADRLAMEFPQVEAYYGEFTKLLFVGIDGIAISPGIAKDHPLICAAVADGVPLFGDVELFAQALPKNQRVLAITGSNGKTTTTELTRVLCEAAGLSAIAAGNIGEPVLDVLECFEGGAFFPDVFVLELSSYQLETTMSLSPSAAAILNISENHLDRYPDMDVYTAAKARIFDRAKAQVLNIDDARVRAMAMADKTVHYFGTEETDLRPFWSLRNHEGALWLQCNERTLMASDTLSLMGRHNAL